MRRLLPWLVTASIPAAIGARFPAPSYYRRLSRPAWAPAPWLFGPVWTVLYGIMGVAAWLVARDPRPGSRAALVLWGAQLALNAAWTPIFFGLRARGLALAEIVALWLAVAATTVAFFRRRLAAGVLLLPYLGWVSYATALTASIWRRNR
jgi:tryptophan-rich sensory protein